MEMDLTSVMEIKASSEFAKGNRMREILHNSNMAIVGGGRVCKAILEIIFSEDFIRDEISILGVADIDESAGGLLYAGENGIFTTDDFTDLYGLKDLNLIIELTGDLNVLQELRATKPDGVQLIDHFEAMSIWDYLQIEKKGIMIKTELHEHMGDPFIIEERFDLFSHELAKIVEERTQHLQDVEKELVERERTLAQIIQGNSLPTFVVNKDHLVTHWNRACERLTGYSFDEIVGTNNQWIPFWPENRPVLADIIVDEIPEIEIGEFYGDKCRRSALIEGAFEAEEFFPNLGDSGKWIFITAAPIKAPDGKVVGAIETLWDRTEDKRREEERERHNRELSALSSITMALSTSLDLEDKLKAVTEEIFKSLSVDGVCIFLREADESFNLRYSYGISASLCNLNCTLDGINIIDLVAQKGELAIYEDIEADSKGELGVFAQEGLRSVAYIPITAKEKKVFGIIRIGSKISGIYTPEERNILELIGNRIGVAIENSLFYEQYRKSEEKYRSLFDNDPNPIFILDSQTFRILDVNRRAQDCYGYSKEDLLGTSFLALGDQRDEEIIDGLKHLTEGQSILISKKKHYRKGHIAFYVNVNVCNTKYSEGYALIATTTDISESVKKDTQLIQASKMTTLGTMTAGMAHEINQPLNVIQVGADFFLKKIKRGEAFDTEELKTVASEIRNNVQRAAEIIKHMKDFSRQSDVVASRLNINAPIRDVFKVLGQQLRVHQIELELDLDENLPPIKADHNRLEQVFINLVTNAMDALDEKGDKITNTPWKRLLRIRSFSDGDQVVVTVSDTGIGISEEMMDKIFEPFFTTKEVGRGTGLGTSISYGIIKDYGGTIDVRSEINKGTTFELRFPSCS